MRLLYGRVAKECCRGGVGLGSAVVISLVVSSLGMTLSAEAVNVLMQHYNTFRTGANTNEYVLSVSNVNSNQFGKLFSRAVDGQIYSQPLYVHWLAISNKTRNVVYVCTEHNSVYAFDADDPIASNALWQVNLGPSAPSSELICKDIIPEAGITSTPTIDLASGTMYVEAKTKEVAGTATNYFHKLHALDILTGQEKFGGPVVIGGSVLGTGVGSDGTNVLFDAFLQWNRPGILVLSNVVYIAFGEACNTQAYHGWMFSYNATNLQQVAMFCTTPDGGAGGIWGSGTGPAADADGNIYVITTNGSFDHNTGGRNYGQTFIKFTTTNGTLAVGDWFTPWNQGTLTTFDRDVGASGPLLLPSTNFLVDVSKDGIMYVVNRDHLGGYINGPGDTNIVQEFSAMPGTAGTCCIGQNLVYWQGPATEYIFFWPGGNVVREFEFDGSMIQTNPLVSGNTRQAERAGGSSLSANGNTPGTGLFMGITADSKSNGVLYAFDATDVSQVLWNSEQNATRDALGKYVKFCAPTIVNGKVYAPTTSNKLVVYGLLGTPYQIWQQNNFTSAELTNAAISGNSADPDGDGIPNLEEYAFGLYPKVASPTGWAALNIQTVSNATYRAIRHVQVPFNTDLSYIVEVSDDGTTWNSGSGHTVPMGLPIDNGDGSETVLVRNATPTDSMSQQFIRLRISGPVGIGTNTQTDFIVVSNIPPLLVVAPTNYSFGLLPVGQVNTQDFSVINAGLDALSGTASVNGSGFALLSGSPYNILDGQTGIVSVTFAPTGDGSFTGSVIFTSNGGIVTNAVTGAGATAPVAGFTGAPTNGIAPLAVTFTNISTGMITNGFWDFGDGSATNVTVNSVLHMYAAGTYTVVLVVAGPGGVGTNTQSDYIAVATPFQAWQVQYFGSTSNPSAAPEADADGTGQNNLFKYTAGLDPTNPASIFILRIADAIAQSNQECLIFNPIATGRTYTPQFCTDLVSVAWTTLTGCGGPVTNINQVTITDTNAIEPNKFYRIDISSP